jgi:pyruvate formate lyase activating enzyme
MSQMNALPLITDIKRHSLEDGPGIRSVVFFKGCPLRCVFCQNPETQNPGVELAFFPKKCIGCGSCAEACTEKAINLDLLERIHREKCNLCGRCVDVCPGNALTLIGAYYPSKTLTDILLRDLPFYRHSGGGVTFSGGECTIYPDYVESVLKSLKSRAVHVVLETAGYFNYDTFKQKILPYIDLIYYDIKIAEPVAHHHYTGKPNQRIMENFRRLVAEKRVEVQPRIPLVPGITATRENLLSILDFLWEAGADDASLLPYNPMGIQMAVSLGKPKAAVPYEFMKPEQQIEIYSFFREIIEQKAGCSFMA